MMIVEGTDEQKAAMFTAFASAQAEFEPVRLTQEVTVRTKAGGTYKFRYADLTEIIRATRPALNKHGITITQAPTIEPDPQGGMWITMVAYLLHAGGGSIQYAPLQMPMTGRGEKDIGGIITYAKRYQMVAILGISAEQDTDGLPQSLDDVQPVNGAAKAQPKATKAQLADIHRKGGEKWGDDWKPNALGIVSEILGTTINSSADLTRTQAADVIDRLLSFEYNPFTEE